MFQGTAFLLGAAVIEKEAVVIFVGDVVGPSGLRAVFAHLPAFAKKKKADIVIANGENAQRGFGIGKEEIEALVSSGVDVITSGNHVWERKDAEELIGSTSVLLRPANYPAPLPGRGVGIFKGRNHSWAVINLQGREDLYPIDCPFRTADEIIARVKREQPDAFIVIDFHAEAAEEKEALAWHVDGRASVLAGTHTHVQTADERILPLGTGYLTDLGMSGPLDSVIGVKTDICIQRSLTQIPIKMETSENEASVCGAVFTIDTATRKCLKIERFELK